MTIRNPRQQRGAWGAAPVKLPQLQTARVEDPQVQKALEALREWVEVRLGSRGDEAERALTLREYNRLTENIAAKVNQLRDFNGDIATLRATPLDAIPTEVIEGAFVTLTTNELYFGTAAGWKKVTLT